MLQTANKIKTDIQISYCTDNNANDWNQYLESHDQANFYQKFEWKSINERNFGHKSFFITAKLEGKIVGIFPIILIKSYIFGKMLTSMPFVNFGGPCASNNEVTDILLKEAEKVAKEYNIDYLEIRSNYNISTALPTSLHKISMTLELNQDPDILWNKFKSKHRTNIRRVYKENIHVKYGTHELLDHFYIIMSKSWKQHGTPIYKKSYFRDILNTFPDQTLIFIAYIDNKPIATAFNGYFKGFVEGMWAGSLPYTRKIQPNYVLYWEMIKHACESGNQFFHLGRSSADTGSEEFKKKWNAEAQQLYWQYILNNQESIPQLNVNNPKFKLAIKAWKKLPLRVTTILGPLLARNIP